MSGLTPAERLREAARVLRERSEAVSGDDEWQSWSGGISGGFAIPPHVRRIWRDGQGRRCSQGFEVPTAAHAAWIATVHPGVGALFADWLELLADEAEVLETILPPHPGTPTHPAMRVADAVLGEP